ncbi:MAG: hypothetical protein JWP72_1021 [Massilia sp.]|jgi:DNA-binding CsgD family transcriptional regulator|nr:hypothetical protein [Massilia sp.]
MSAQQNDIDRCIMRMLVECTKVRTASEFTGMVEGSFRSVLPHGSMLCGIGGVSRQGSHIRKILSVDYPLEYFDPLTDEDGRLDSPLMKRWRETLEPQLFQSGRDDHLYPDDWVRLFNKYDLRNTIAHGVLDLGGVFSSFFIFSRIPGEVGAQQAFLMKLLTTVDDYQGRLGKSKKALSERQRDILHWLEEGKTNWEIAKILDFSELNVKYHIDQIFLKLEVRSRAHAVARARDLASCRA